MAKGRKPLPREIKELQGTLEKSRDNFEIPDFGKVTGVDSAPEYLSEPEKKMFISICKDLINARVLENPNISQVVRLVVYNTQWHDCLKTIRDKGIFMNSQKKGRVIKPDFTAMQYLEKMIRDLESDLGLSPASRQRLKITPKEPEKQKTDMQNLLD